MTRAAWFLFSALSVIWGVPYFFIKIALLDLAPDWIAFARVALGALLLAPFVPRVDWRALRPRAFAVVAVALTDIAIPFYLIANGERFVSSSLTGLLLAALPIVVALLVFALDPRERPTRLQIVGFTIGIAGVATLLGFDAAANKSALTGAALVTGATLSYAVGVVLIKRWFNDLPLLASSAAMLLAAAVMLAPAALLHMPSRAPGPATVGAIIVLGAVCTSAAYVLDFALIARAGATRASVVAYLNPVVAVLLGVLVLREPMHATSVAGLLLVVAGSWLSTGGKPPRRRARTKPALLPLTAAP